MKPKGHFRSIQVVFIVHTYSFLPLRSSMSVLWAALYYKKTHFLRYFFFLWWRILKFSSYFRIYILGTVPLFYSYSWNGSATILFIFVEWDSVSVLFIVRGLASAFVKFIFIGVGHCLRLFMHLDSASVRFTFWNGTVSLLFSKSAKISP
jgi:hypothetical protein